MNDKELNLKKRPNPLIIKCPKCRNTKAFVDHENYYECYVCGEEVLGEEGKE